MEGIRFALLNIRNFVTKPTERRLLTTSIADVDELVIAQVKTPES